MTPYKEVRLLQHLLGVVAVGHQGADVPSELLLHAGEQLDNPVVSRASRFVHFASPLKRCISLPHGNSHLMLMARTGQNSHLNPVK